LPSGAPLSFQQLPNTPPAAGLAAPGMFLPLAHAQLAAFVVGPGFLPVPGKTVTNIISGQYIDLATLLAKPSDMRSPSPLIYIDGQVVVSHASKPARRLTDISQWLQAFTIYMLIMVTYLPNRAADLVRYQLLILRMYTQFGGLAWYNYDEAFRRDAAARHVVDWSGINCRIVQFSHLCFHQGPSTFPCSSLPRKYWSFIWNNYLSFLEFGTLCSCLRSLSLSSCLRCVSLSGPSSSYSLH
jgi:hypothetical protein